jgi:deoxyribodipyrimidine photo-lyase
MSSPVLLWLWRELRLADNPALVAALASGRPVLPVFILDETTPGPWAPGAAARWWLHHSLASLAADLAACGAPLVLRRGRITEELPRLVQETDAAAVYAGQAIEPWARAVIASLGSSAIPLHLHRTTTLFDLPAIRTRSGDGFGIFTPFARACLLHTPPPMPSPAPARIPSIAPPRSDRLQDWHLLPTRPDWSGGLQVTWQPGEAGAVRRLQRFIESNLENYHRQRDFPAIDATAMLSPHLAWGEISVSAAWHAAGNDGKGPAHWRNELLWREFCAHLLWHNPNLPELPLRRNFARIPWRDDAAGLRAWQRGRTGVPIVDAGMRQLWQTGWMHNRVRMIVASFLAKHLLLPWQKGEAWFWDTLVDADLASNAAQWQWVAGCGTDAAPFFRIFNPVLQAQRFDPDGVYVRRFVPELARLPLPALHAPWRASPLQLADAGIVLGRDYPLPLVDLATGRARALAALRVVSGTRM